MGGKAAKMLIERLEAEEEDEEQYKTEVIETELVERESTKSLIISLPITIRKPLTEIILLF